jgi:hypothetical protein
LPGAQLRVERRRALAFRGFLRLYKKLPRILYRILCSSTACLKPLYRLPHRLYPCLGIRGSRLIVAIVDRSRDDLARATLAMRRAGEVREDALLEVLRATARENEGRDAVTKLLH